MESVFIAGSLSIKNINQVFLSRIDNIINENLSIIIGDADGVDKSIQEYLFDKKYEYKFEKNIDEIKNINISLAKNNALYSFFNTSGG